jgi:anti-sigma factor RsiW
MTLDRRARRYVGAASLLAAGAVAGGILAGTFSASAASGSGSTSGTPSAAAPTPPANAKSSAPLRSDENTLSSSVTATLKAKALAAVPGGTVYRIESDAGDGVYEAHMTKADGSLVTVKFDKSLNVTHVEAGMGTGDPGPAGGRGGPGGGGPSA